MDHKSDGVRVTYICVASAISIALLLRMIWLIRHRNDPIRIDVTDEGILIQDRDYRFDRVKKITIYSNLLNIRINPWWSTLQYKIDLEKKPEIASVLQNIATERQIAFMYR